MSAQRLHVRAACTNRVLQSLVSTRVPLQHTIAAAHRPSKPPRIRAIAGPGPPLHTKQTGAPITPSAQQRRDSAGSLTRRIEDRNTQEMGKILQKEGQLAPAEVCSLTSHGQCHGTPPMHHYCARPYPESQPCPPRPWPSSPQLPLVTARGAPNVCCPRKERTICRGGG